MLLNIKKIVLFSLFLFSSLKIYAQDFSSFEGKYRNDFLCACTSIPEFKPIVTNSLEIFNFSGFTQNRNLTEIENKKEFDSKFSCHLFLVENLITERQKTKILKKITKYFNQLSKINQSKLKTTFDKWLNIYYLHQNSCSPENQRIRHLSKIIRDYGNKELEAIFCQEVSKFTDCSETSEIYQISGGFYSSITLIASWECSKQIEYFSYLFKNSIIPK